MSYILVATDFSAIADNAANYACAFARAYKQDVILVNTYTVPIAFEAIPMQVIPVDEARQWAQEKMTACVRDLKEKFLGVAVAGRVEYGDMTEVLKLLAGELSEPMLIVVGNSTHGEGPHWLDSNMMESFRVLKVPVLAIPPAASFKLVSRICLAFDNQIAGTKNALFQLEEIVRLAGASLDVLVAEADVQDRDNMPDVDQSVVEELKHLGPHYHYQYQITIEKMATEFVKEQKTDWLAVIPRHHSMITSLFHKSHTLALARLMDIPVLALHEQH